MTIIDNHLSSVLLFCQQLNWTERQPHTEVETTSFDDLRRAKDWAAPAGFKANDWSFLIYMFCGVFCDRQGRYSNDLIFWGSWRLLSLIDCISFWSNSYDNFLLVWPDEVILKKYFLIKVSYCMKHFQTYESLLGLCDIGKTDIVIQFFSALVI